jgi:site-specific DNA-cytosine methylase
VTDLLPYVDCQGLGGAWTLGTLQTGGFELIHRASLKGGFGDKAVEHNRALLPGPWAQDAGENAQEWEPQVAAYLNGTPPCSGFSLLNVTAATAKKQGKEAPDTGRGIDSSINECMRELVRYAGRCTGTDGKGGPEIVSFESVQGAGKLGRPLMQALRLLLEEVSGQRYNLHHVFMSGSSIGAAQMRHRYYVVFARVPFGVDAPEPRKVVTYRDAIGDLEGLDMSWDPQRIPVSYASSWLDEQGIVTDVSELGEYSVADHITVDVGNSIGRRIYIEELMPLWEPGHDSTQPMAKYREIHGSFPPGTERWWDYENDRRKGFNGGCRIMPDKPGYVLTGGCVGAFVHYSENRFLTVRECARLMGYPDAWRFNFASGPQQAGMFIGKCCPVQSGRWISTWVLNALNGEPGDQGQQIGEREFMTDCTLDYRRWPKEISQYEYKVKKAA